MIVLDTNVLSALMRARPDPSVVAWLDTQPVQSVWITAITLFEARFGLALLPAGKRRISLEEQLSRLLREDLEGRILDFDETSAREAAALAAGRQKSGRPVDMRDTFIAGIVLARKAALATGNTRHFRDFKVAVINPWDTASKSIKNNNLPK
uniref:Ribonuclease VapC n=1 Tax=Candidatus Kentrum sp. FM TaxID=2126340 RepID=A0A450S5Y5_9GAMM|nr:MAG: hypothetical protein BECKFM1743A_GA0114220_100465 [Candidatus Kentron sp. FM]VFJ47536.1 MAG: hypothetical protein BECKFM1743C_GA0114222_100465 [Candidatus Kentron sp. FM]VFK07806.1 MAG: hypothetical protein BECKFM1743B_GA0114221_100517 [Candidatus Kentron sp. FM]